MSKKTSAIGKIYQALIYVFLYAPILVIGLFSFNGSKASRRIGTRSCSATQRLCTPCKIPWCWHFAPLRCLRSWA